MTPARYERICRALRQRQPDLTVVTDEVHKGRNLSAILRSCDAVGIDVLHVVTPTNGFRAYRGTSLGTHKWVQVRQYDSLDGPLEQLQPAGFQIVAAHAGASACDYRQIDYTRPTALLLGAEREGLSPKALAEADHCVTIPMLGMVESLNVSVACAAILLEAQHQRRCAGYYDLQRLEPEAFNRRFFQWAHPSLADYCDKHGLQYPATREDGELEDPSGWYRSVRADTGEVVK